MRRGAGIRWARRAARRVGSEAVPERLRRDEDMPALDGLDGSQFMKTRTLS